MFTTTVKILIVFLGIVLYNITMIVDAVRSPMGVKNGNLIGIRADDLAAQVVIALLERQPDLAAAHAVAAWVTLFR
mgnify:CR=1 FL=1